MHRRYKKKRIGLACAAFGKLDKMWRTRNISLKTKMKLYDALVLPVLMHGLECWTMRKEDERRLLVAEMAWLRRIRGRSRRERIRNEKTREELGADEMVIEKIERRRLTWFGHMERMEGKRLPNAALHGHVRGERSRGRQRKRWMNNAREGLENKGISIIYSIWKNQEQRSLEKYNKDIIVSKLMEEKKEEEDCYCSCIHIKGSAQCSL